MIGIFGNGEIAKVFAHYQTPTFFTVDKEFNTGPLLGLPVVDFDKDKLYPQIDENGIILNTVSPSAALFLFPISYTKLNSLRKEKLLQAKEWGLNIGSYIDTTVKRFYNIAVGEGSIVLDGCTINPLVQLGKGVICWSNAHVGHSSILEDFVWVTTNATICGQCTIGEQSFIGANAVIAPQVKIGKRNIIAAGAIVTKDTEDDAVYLEGRNNKIDKKSWEISL